MHLTKSKLLVEQLGFDFTDCPDIAQTLAVTTGALNVPAFFTGLHTLKIKETDRIAALKTELEKFGILVQAGEDTMKIKERARNNAVANSSPPIATYEDHRMAMCFAPLAFLYPSITIEHPEVVNKSYPDFWTDLEKVGFVIEEA